MQGRLQAEHLDQSWSLPWQHNMQSRDFTVNALMYDPFSHLLFDYVGGMQDCQKRRLRCIKEPAQSFAEDPARMLRAVRLSTRIGKTHATSLWCERCYINSHVLSEPCHCQADLPCLVTLPCYCTQLASLA